MDIELSDNVSRHEWNQLIARDRDATFFHTYQWARHIEATIPGWRNYYLTARENGRLAGAVPFMTRAHKGALVAASMPLGTYGGVIVDPDASRAIPHRLADRFIDIGRSSRVVRGELVDFAGRVAPVDRPDTKTTTSYAHVVDLEPGYEALWRGFRQSNRNKVRKARRAGITVRRARAAADFHEYYKIWALCCRRWGRRDYLGSRFFCELDRLDQEGVHLWLAEDDGKPIAGLLNFAWGRTVLSWGNVSLSGKWCHAPNNLLHVVAIQDAIRRGAHTYSFGTNPDLPGVEVFKSSFGTRPRPYRCYRTEKSWFRLLRETKKTLSESVSELARPISPVHAWRWEGSWL